jgi:hypothetical protein
MTDMTEYEVYKRDRTPAVSTPAVTVTQRGVLSINDAAFAELGSPKAVELMYSRADRIIGLRPVDPAEPHAYVPRTRPSKNRNHGPYTVSGAAFFSYFGIKIDQTTRFTATVQDGILTIDLKKPGVLLASSEAKPADRADGRRKTSQDSVSR